MAMWTALLKAEVARQRLCTGGCKVLFVVVQLIKTK